MLYSCSFFIAPSLGAYQGFFDSELLLIDKLLKQGLPVATLKSSLYLSQMTTSMFRVSFRSI